MALFPTLLYLTVFFVVILGVPRLIAEVYARPRLFSAEGAPPARVAIVFGAGLQRNGTPSPVLQDRVAAAAQLYFSGKVEKILMSGDNRFVYYNEPGAMLNYAIRLGVPPEAVVLDYAGRSTYDTCYRALKIFGVQQAILVTQRFHLPRALLTCNVLGLKADGVIADRQRYVSYAENYWYIREIPATLAAIWDIWVSKPLPILGKPEPIFSAESGQEVPIKNIG